MVSGLLTKGVCRAAWDFYRRGLRGRWGEIIFTQEMTISVLLGIFFGAAGNHIFSGSAKLLDIAVGFLGYAAIALGFCVGGMTIALTFPDREFMKKLATFTIDKRDGDALSNLLFVFSWTAVVHWLSLLLILAAILLRGHEDADLLSAQSLSSRIEIGVIVGLCVYALLQFLITVLTLWQVGGVYIQRLKQETAE